MSNAAVLATFFFWFSLWMKLAFGMGARPSARRLVVCVMGVWLSCWGWPLLPGLGIDVAALYWWRGLWGDLSAASLFLSAYMLVTVKRSGWCLMPLVWSLACLGCVLYPFSLGIGSFDPYVLGYRSPYVLVGVYALLLPSLWRGYYPIVCWLALGLVLWQASVLDVGWFESLNVWDHLLDPMAWSWACGMILYKTYRWMGER